MRVSIRYRWCLCTPNARPGASSYRKHPHNDVNPRTSHDYLDCPFCKKSDGQSTVVCGKR